MMNKIQKLPPYRLVQTLGNFRALILKLHRSLFPGSVVLYEQFQSFWMLQPLYIAAELNIAGLLREKPLTAAELAIRTGTDPEALYRVLRALSSSGIFKESDARLFKLNSRSRALLDGEGSMRNMIIHHLGAVNWSAAGNLMHTVKTGENAFSALFGSDIYPYLQQNHEEMQKFEKSMSDLSALALEPMISRYDFSGFKTIADIGGGEGFLLSAILNIVAGAKGILFDLPENSGKAKEFISSRGLSEKIFFQAGSFLEPFSLEADLYIMKNVLHNWNDALCSRILENLGKTVSSGAKLLILEMVVPGPSVPSYAKLVDIQMLATMPGGKERTKQEFEVLLRQSGFRLNRVIPTIAPLAILETVRE
ncbi:MAG: methyltransferase [Bacteroidetes bacterium]|nr:methyltransferase [Bacteroidota bacterium]